MSVAPHAGVIDFGTFTSPTVSVDGIQGEVPAPSASQYGYFLSTAGWQSIPVSGGTVTSVSGSGSVNGITLSGTVTSSGSLTLGGTLSGIGNSQLTNSSITINGTLVSLGGSITTPSGTVTSVSGTSPISVATGTTTPAISISQATTSTNGYLSSTDWNTFNNKGSGTVTSVAALTLGTTGTDLTSTVATGTTTPVITLNVPTASASNRGALSSADWTTFNNKIGIAPRVNTTTSSSSITIDTSTTDQYTVTALAVGTTFNAPTGSPSNGQKLTIRIKDNGTAQTIAWNAIFRVIGTTLFTTTVANKTFYVGCIYNSTDTTWDVISVAQQV